MTAFQDSRTVLIAGASGLIGSALTTALLERGNKVIVLSRQSSPAPPQHPNLSVSRWDPATGVLNQAVVDRSDVVVNLAGASIGARRWSAQYKQTILESRTTATALIAQAVHNSPTPPQVFLQGSASGFYGNTDAVVDEQSAVGATFLAKVCASWEKAAAPAMSKGTRLAFIRTATVMSPKDGALKKLLLPMRFGVGGTLGNGTQDWSWITLDDHVRALLFVMDTPTAWGPINLVAPEFATNSAITRAIAQAISKPARFQVPAGVLRLVLGEFANEILMSQKISPMILTQLGFQFLHPTVADLATYVRKELDNR
ncbi:TIGR01777 family oxidoreductase [Jonesiaceae bacterium BS-20]|uniref:TIGR01777 family oxidoreductase n=1 Tax=Jonesiaceae bacterium BS-20 TaxID=3120821 RepID=A0AAU7DS97_9MICO